MMSQTLLKPRWKTWETICIQKAYKENIQRKVVSMALGRSPTSISKKIKKLGLKPLATASDPLKRNKKNLLNFKKMKGILKKYAPLNVFLRAEVTVREARWILPPSPPLKELKRGKCVGCLETQNASFSMFMPLEYIISKDQVSLGRGAKLKEPLCVPLYHVEMWAVGEGFHTTTEVLREQGLSYWKEGQYFSQAQLLMHINQIRHGKSLQPLILLEKEMDSKR
jgi:hypothetical protein